MKIKINKNCKCRIEFSITPDKPFYLFQFSFYFTYLPYYQNQTLSNLASMTYAKKSEMKIISSQKRNAASERKRCVHVRIYSSKTNIDKSLRY